MHLACIILNWKSAGLAEKAMRSTERALQFAMKQDAELSVRLIVVDNDSQDGSLERLTAFASQIHSVPCEVISSGSNGGYGFGNNAGIRHAWKQQKPDAVYIQNPDAFPEPEAIHALLRAQQCNCRLGLASSFIYGSDGQEHVTAFRFPSPASELLAGARLRVLGRLVKDKDVAIIPRPSETCRVDWSAGASMLITREVIEQVGMFDEQFFLYFEETDLCFRAKKAGFETWYVIESRVEHIGSATTNMKAWKEIPGYWWDSRRHYFTKHHGARGYMLANALALVGNGTYHIRKKLLGSMDQHEAKVSAHKIKKLFKTFKP